MKRSDATAALSWANDTRAAGDTRITAVQFRILCVIAGGCRTRAEISAAAGCGESTVPRAVRKLESIGAIKRVPIPGKANDYAVQVRPDTGIPGDTGIATSRVAKSTRITKVPELSDTGADGDTGQAVDNAGGHIKHAHARAEPKQITTLSELNPETLSPSSTSTAPKILNGSAAGMTAHALAAIVVETVNSRRLDPSKFEGLGNTTARIKAWMNAGCDFDQDIIPGVRAGCAALERECEFARTWNYFTNFVLKASKQRKAAEQPIDVEAPHDQHRTGASDASNIRRERVSPTTAARHRRRAEREAQRDAIDLGRVESERIG